MLRSSEIILTTLVTIACFLGTVYLLFTSNYVILVFLPIISLITIISLLKRHKKTTKYIKKDLKHLGYEIISERPLKFSELKIAFTPSILINNTPLKKHKNKFERIFTVKNKKGKTKQLNIIITENLKGQIKFKILNKNHNL